MDFARGEGNVKARAMDQQKKQSPVPQAPPVRVRNFHSDSVPVVIAHVVRYERMENNLAYSQLNYAVLPTVWFILFPGDPIEENEGLMLVLQETLNEVRYVFQ